MAITYPITLPLSRKVARARFRFVSSVGVSVSPFTFQAEVQANEGQMWEAVFTILGGQEREDIAPLIAALVSLNGREGTFLAGDPLGGTPRGVATGTPIVNGAGQSGRTLLTEGWTASVTGILKAQDWIQLGSGAGAHLHMVVADADSDAAGIASLEIWPRLRTAPADDEPIVVDDTVGIWRLASSANEWDEDLAARYGLAFAAEEAL